MSPKKPVKPKRVCGVRCRVHGGAPCVVEHDEAAHGKHLRDQRAGPIAMHVTDACYPHHHSHCHILEDETLLTHSWYRGTLAAGEGDQQFRLPRDIWGIMRPGVPGGRSISREEWERLRAEIPVKSTRLEDYISARLEDYVFELTKAARKLATAHDDGDTSHDNVRIRRPRAPRGGGRPLARDSNHGRRKARES